MPSVVLLDMRFHLTAFLQAHITILEGSEDSRRALLQGLEYLVQISFVDDDEVCVAAVAQFLCSLRGMQRRSQVERNVQRRAATCSI